MSVLNKLVTEWTPISNGPTRRWYYDGQRISVCPACGTEYMIGDEIETRPMVKCHVCEGDGMLADQAQAMLIEALKETDIETMRALGERCAPGYWRFRVRSRVKQLNEARANEVTNSGEE